MGSPLQVAIGHVQNQHPSRSNSFEPLFNQNGNSFKNIVEYTVPVGGICVERISGSTKLSNNLNIGQPYLAGGGEQIPGLICIP